MGSGDYSDQSQKYLWFILLFLWLYSPGSITNPWNFLIRFPLYYFRYWLLPLRLLSTWM